MTSRAVVFIFSWLLLSCTYDHIPNSNPAEALARAKSRCNLPAEEMQWLADLIRQSETNFSFKGPIYAIPTEGQVVILHQPYIMSCLACRLYRCDGTRIDISTVDTQALMAGMTDSNLIYSPFLE